MTSSITRCPKCSTSFRVTPLQLKSAKGAVRCGSCLHIFNAEENFVTVKPAAQKAATPKAQSQTAPAKPKPKVNTAPAPQQLAFDQSAIDAESELDDILISDDMESGESDSAKYQGTMDDLAEFQLNPTKQNWLDDGSSLFDASPKQSSFHLVDEDEDEDQADESWALKMLEEESHTPSKPVKQTPSAAFKKDTTQDFSTESSEDDDDEVFRFDVDESQPSEDDELKTLRFDDPLEDDLEEDTSRFDGSRTGSFDAVGDDFDDLDNYDNFSDFDEPPQKSSKTSDSFAIEDDELAKLKRELEGFDDPDEDQMIPEPGDRQEFLHALAREPVEMTVKPKKSNRIWIKSALILGNVVLLLAVIIQIGYLKFDTWSRVEPYRQWYSMACPVFGCTLPTRYDYNKIRITLVVRTHPTLTNALIADAVLLNTAGFEQPYPSLALRFSDLNDNPLAERVFNPREYLRGELAGETIMPVKQPIHISLEIADPGEAAVNYRAFIPDSNLNL